MKRDIILATDALTLRPGGHAVLSGVRLAVVRARVTALVGPAGSGKSALLGVLSGSVPPCSGTVKLNGRSIAGLSPQALNRLGVWCVGPDGLRPDGRTVRERIARGAQWHVRGYHAALAQADEVARRLGIEFELHKSSDCLQQASRRRLALACVLAARPQLLLLDGFLDGLAPPESAAMVAPIRGLCAEGVTVLMAERVMPAVSRLADDVAVLAGGRLIAHGSPDQVSRDPAVTRAYAGHAAPPGAIGQAQAIDEP
ncbi:hypothetical protein AWV80_15830 [Cupriavidus sp. UYMU48A]|nr:hypothetical protein AWV80_15830 [Cupriavidus sp. UYMU48A]